VQSKEQMRFWDISGLAMDLAHHRLSSYQKMRYTLAVGVMFVMGIQLYTTISWADSPFMYVKIICLTAIAAAGIDRCYRSNLAGDNSDLIERIVCLSWPVSLRVAGISLLIFSIVGGFFDLNDELIDFVAVVALEIFFFRLLSKAMKLTASLSPLETLENSA
jgi:hypothetical protein